MPELPPPEPRPAPELAAPGIAAIVLAGGRSRRFGTDKLAADVRGRPLLDAALEVALGVAARVVVVGPDDRAWPDRVSVVREEPAYAGPFAAVVTGAAALDTGGAGATTGVLVLAGDLVDPAPIVPRLVAALVAGGAPAGAGRTADAAVAVDADGRRQPLLAVYRLDALLAAGRRGDPRDRPARDLLDGLAVTEVPDTGRASRDIDTPGDLARETAVPSEALRRAGPSRGSDG